MDDISREPHPEDPGQGLPDRGARHKGPAEWSEAVGGGAVDGLDREVGGAAEPAGPDVPGGFDREELLMALNVPFGDEPDDRDPGGDADPEDHPQAAAPDEDGEPGTDAAPDAEQLGRVLCALLLSSRESLTILRLAQVTNTSGKEVKAALDDLGARLQAGGLPLEVAIRGERVSLLTTPDVFAYIGNLRTVKKQEKLSAAALETLAVVAYRQPVIRAEIEAIRGVKAGPILRTLLDHRMIKSVGRADVPGRPLQYGTTQHFLETFGLESLADLPSVKEFRQL